MNILQLMRGEKKGKRVKPLKHNQSGIMHAWQTCHITNIIKSLVCIDTDRQRNNQINQMAVSASCSLVCLAKMPEILVPSLSYLVIANSFPYLLKSTITVPIIYSVLRTSLPNKKLKQRKGKKQTRKQIVGNEEKFWFFLLLESLGCG